MNYKFIYAVAILIGMIVGAGTFGIPYVFAQAGFSAGFFYLVVIGLAVTAVHLFFGEIILRTNQPHWLVGYAAKYFGPGAKKITMLIILFEYYGALLAYLILGGQFLSIIFNRLFAQFKINFLAGGANLELFWVIIFFLIGLIGILWRMNTLARNEFFMTAFLILVVIVFLIKGAPLIHAVNLTTLNFSNFFLPYGVIFFAMAGAAAIPEMRQILKGQEKKLKSAIILGTAIPAVLYLFFALVIVGVSGSQTSEEAIQGLVPYLGQWVIILGAIFGFLAVYTSFLVLGAAIKKIYQEDLHLHRTLAFFLACLVPLVAYLFGLNNFTLIIGFIGAVFSGLDGILTIFIYFKARVKGDREPEYRLPFTRVLGTLLVLLFSLGIIYQFVYLAK